MAARLTWQKTDKTRSMAKDEENEATTDWEDEQDEHKTGSVIETGEEDVDPIETGGEAVDKNTKLFRATKRRMKIEG